RLDRLPMSIGDWSGRPEPVDSRQLAAAELDAGLMRRYENCRTGKTVDLVIVCGRPGPVSVHTPDVCYSGAGYQMTQLHPAGISLKPSRRGDRAEFLRGDFEKQGPVSSDRLRIYWSWSAT